MFGIGKKPQRRQVAKPVIKQKAKAVAKQEVRLVVAQPKPQKAKQTKQLNPYLEFTGENKDATIDDLTTYFEFRNSRVSTRSTLGMSTVLSVMALLLVAYYPMIESAVILDSLPLGNYVAVIFVGAMAASIALIGKQAKMLSPKEINRHFRMYLEAKDHLQAKNKVHEQPETSDEEMTVSEPQAAAIRELAEEIQAGKEEVSEA